MDIYDWTCRGPLKSMVVHAVVHGLLSIAACVDRERSPDRPLTARDIARAASGWFGVHLWSLARAQLGRSWHQRRTGQAL